MIPFIITLVIFYIIYIYPMYKDMSGGYQSKYDTIMDSYIDLELSKRYNKDKCSPDLCFRQKTKERAG